jgi:hypothetical protein
MDEKKDNPGMANKTAEERKERNKTYTDVHLLPHESASRTLAHIIPKTDFGDGLILEASYFDILPALQTQTAALKKGDMSQVENILFCQALTLDRLFNVEIVRALQEKTYEGFKIRSDLALKAQRQCRATVETLARVKNPQPYVRQQNVAVNQQVNNGAPPPSKNSEIVMPPAQEDEEKQKVTTELLEDRGNEYQRMDARAPGAAGGADTDMEAVATLYRAENE